jgi:hypothetical protein
VHFTLKVWKIPDFNCLHIPSLKTAIFKNARADRIGRGLAASIIGPANSICKFFDELLYSQCCPLSESLLTQKG